MRLPQRFKRVPHQEPAEDQDIILPAYPSQTKIDMKDDINIYDNERFEPTRTDTEYAAGAYTTERYTIVHRKTWVERLEEFEHRRFGTRILSFFYSNVISGWRAGLLRAFVASLLALLLNVSIFAWLSARFDLERGTGLVHSGNCGAVDNIETGIKVGLNVLSTLILGASTYAMQGTTAPTRKEVDRAHSKGKWLEIGTQSWRNLGYVSKRHVAIWSVLAFTSLPLHLVFNAVFFTTTETYQYAVAVVDQGFLNNTEFQPTAANSSPARFAQHIWSGKCNGGGNDKCDWNVQNDTTIFQLLNDARNPNPESTYEQMTPSECIRNYSESFMQRFSDVVVVTKTVQADDPILWSRYPQRVLTKDKRDTNNDPFHWVCQDSSGATNESGICYKNWALDNIVPGNWTVYGQPVDYCFARRAPNRCRLQYNVWIWGAVLVFSIFKVSAIAVLVFTHPKRESKFLRTIGDAIASFLEQPDPTTKDMCLVSSGQIRKHGFTYCESAQLSSKPRRRWWSRSPEKQVTVPYAPQTFTNDRPRWWVGANTTEFFSTVGISAAYVIVLTGTLAWATTETNGNAFETGIGKPDIQSLANLRPDDPSSSVIVPTLLTANIPQLGFSLLYVFYTNIWSKLLIAHEFDRLTTSKKGLRVSDRPYGYQRTSHFFTLPTRYAFPLMACSAALHWLCSRSLFMARFDGIKADGTVDPEDQLVRLAYSVTGMAALIAVNFAMMVGTVAMAGLHRLRTGLGEIAMSVVISAACHVQRYEAQPWLQKVQWGDVSGDVGENGDDIAVRHCAFTSLHADPLVVGQEYK